MNRAQIGKVVGWVSIGLGVVSLIIFILKSAAGRDVSPALLIIGAIVLINGTVMLARAKKLQQK